MELQFYMTLLIFLMQLFGVYPSISSPNMKLKKITNIIGIILGIVFLAIQSVQPERTNPPFDPSQTMFVDLQVPPHVSSLFERGCKDCHSNETSWPFYAYVAPVSWLVSHDVTEGRKHFNMSEWGKYSVNRKIQKLSGIFQAINDKSMPLPKYIPLHPAANLTDAERDTLAQWAQTTAEKIMGIGDE